MLRRRNEASGCEAVGQWVSARLEVVEIVHTDDITTIDIRLALFQSRWARSRLAAALAEVDRLDLGCKLLDWSTWNCVRTESLHSIACLHCRHRCCCRRQLQRRSRQSCRGCAEASPPRRLAFADRASRQCSDDCSQAAAVATAAAALALSALASCDCLSRPRPTCCSVQMQPLLLLQGKQKLK